LAESGATRTKISHVDSDTGGRYLTFVLDKESYGLEILKVREIIGMMAITPVPRTPEFVKGVINLRGRIIPVVDLRAKFSLESAESTFQTCIIVVDVKRERETVQMGVTVDEVSDVVDIEPGQVDTTPDFGEGVNTDFILGLGKINSKVVILLDVDKVLTETETGEVASVAKSLEHQAS
jgi:purine-binding chemotaxis protein CheW